MSKEVIPSLLETASPAYSACLNDSSSSLSASSDVIEITNLTSVQVDTNVTHACLTSALSETSVSSPQPRKKSRVSPSQSKYQLFCSLFHFLPLTDAAEKHYESTTQAFCLSCKKEFKADTL